MMSKHTLIIYCLLSIGLNANVASDRFVLLPFLESARETIILESEV